jgi:hypothetical protein
MGLNEERESKTATFTFTFTFTPHLIEYEPDQGSSRK